VKDFLYEFRIRRIRRWRVADALNSSVVRPSDVAAIARKLTNGEAKEIFLAFFLDARNCVIGYETVAIGGLTGVDIHPRETFRAAILSSAAAIILAHNHPSGEVSPSLEDRALTDRMKKAGELLGIPVLDHVIVTEDAYHSIAEEAT